MKKIILTICLAALMIGVIGCEGEPSEWDPKTEGWELWATGIVDVVKIEINNGTRRFFIEFEGELEFEGGNFRNFNDVVEGTKGSIYRYYTAMSNYFMWVPADKYNTVNMNKAFATKKVIPKKAKKEAEQQTFVNIAIIEKIETPPTKYGWQNTMSLPPVQQTVLVKFKDGLVTTAYYTAMKDWKSEVNRRKMSGGIALKEVVKWKLVDLE